MTFKKTTSVCPAESVLEAMQFTPMTWLNIEEFIGGDGGDHPQGGAVFATVDGPLRVYLNWWVVRVAPDTFEAVPPDEFDKRYHRVRQPGVTTR